LLPLLLLLRGHPCLHFKQDFPFKQHFVHDSVGLLKIANHDHVARLVQSPVRVLQLLFVYLPAYFQLSRLNILLGVPVVPVAHHLRAKGHHHPGGEAVLGRVNWIVFVPQFVLPVGEGAPDSEGAVAISVKVGAPDCLEVGVGHLICRLFVYRFEGHRVVDIPQLVGPVGEGTLHAEVAGARYFEELADGSLEPLIDQRLSLTFELRR